MSQGDWFSTGSYGYGLNVILAASTVAVSQNSKRMERDFVLTSVNGAAQVTSIGSTTTVQSPFSLILGTQLIDYFADWVYFSTILGDGALSHFIPGDDVLRTRKGDYLVCKTKNEAEVLNQICLLFEGYHE